MICVSSWARIQLSHVTLARQIAVAKISVYQAAAPSSTGWGLQHDLKTLL